MAALALLLGSAPAVVFACDRDALLNHLRQTARALDAAPAIPKDARSIVLQDLPLALDSYKYVAHVDPASGRAWLVRSGGLTGDVEWFGPVALTKQLHRCAEPEQAGATARASASPRVTVTAAAFAVPASSSKLPVVRIDLAAPGLTAEQVETEVTTPLERRLLALPGLIALRSASMERRCFMELTFDRAVGAAEQAAARQALGEALEKMRGGIAIRGIAIGSPELQ